MAKNKVQTRSDDLDTEEKPVDEGEEVSVGVVGDGEEAEEMLDQDEIDPFHDKWEE